MRIDAHQHFWHPGRGDYGWMPMDEPILYRPYAPSDLAPHLAEHGIDGTVLVQAAPTVEETEYMLGLADACDWILGVVGWVDFERAEDRKALERLAGHPKFKGIRPMIQDIADVDWMLRLDVQWGFRAVEELGLTFDALGFPQHLENFLKILTRYPEMRTVVDHCMKPGIAQDKFAGWVAGMARIAQETGAFCKLSGLVTEAQSDWKVGDLQAYSDHVLSAFGPGRVMWGSDWPVCRLRAEYGVWLEAANALTDELDKGDRARVFGGTAAAFYGLS